MNMSHGKSQCQTNTFVKYWTKWVLFCYLERGLLVLQHIGRRTSRKKVSMWEESFDRKRVSVCPVCYVWSSIVDWRPSFWAEWRKVGGEGSRGRWGRSLGNSPPTGSHNHRTVSNTLTTHSLCSYYLSRWAPKSSPRTETGLDHMCWCIWIAFVFCLCYYF